MRFLLCLALAACGPIAAAPPPVQVQPDAGTPDPQPSAPSYSYAWDTFVLFGPHDGLDKAIAEDAASSIIVSPDLSGVASVSSSNVNVVTFALARGNDISVQAHAPGTADLI